LEDNDLGLIGLITEGNKQAFEKVFTGWYGNLHSYALSVLRDEAIAEEVVQSVFCRIWEKREQLRVRVSLKAYLYGSVYHECLSWLRHEKTRKAYQSRVLRNGNQAMSENAAHKIELGELEKRIRSALEALPDQCRTIFLLSRYGELKYREIADVLGISVKTVESQMSKALKQLREKLISFIA
jgi:RNA polymerase sigma-70 factor (ECF subfamily)